MMDCLDPGRVVKHYPRTQAQNHALGLYTQEELRTAEDSLLSFSADEAPATAEDGDALTEEKLQVGGLAFSKTS
jgi:hypothetical protein